jgi:hypothetical protein
MQIGGAVKIAGGNVDVEEDCRYDEELEDERVDDCGEVTELEDDVLGAALEVESVELELF